MDKQKIGVVEKRNNVSVNRDSKKKSLRRILFLLYQRQNGCVLLQFYLFLSLAFWT